MDTLNSLKEQMEESTEIIKRQRAELDMYRSIEKKI